MHASLKQKVLALKGDYRRLWRALTISIGLTTLEWAQHNGSCKLPTRIGELEQKLGLKFKREWIKLASGKRCIRYSYGVKP